MQNFFDKLNNFLTIVKKKMSRKLKSIFPLTYSERKKYFKKRVIRLPFVIVATYLLVSYVDYILLYMSIKIFFSDAYILQPDYIDFPITDEEDYYGRTNKFITFIISSGIAFIFYYILTLFVYEVKTFMLKSYLFANSVFYLWFCANDPINLVFFTVYYLGGPFSWITYFYNWFWYWGWNIFQWAIDLEEEIEDGEEEEEEQHALELQRLSKSIVNSYEDKGFFNVDVFKNSFSLLLFMYKEITISWTIQEEAEKAYNPRGTSPEQIKIRYRRHLLKYHSEAIAQDELFRKLFIEKYQDLRDSFKDVHWQDYAFFKYESIFTRRLTYQFKEHLWTYVRFFPKIQTLYIFWRYCTEYKPWFNKSARIVGKYSYYTKKYSQLSSVKILLKYYKLEEKSVRDKIKNYLNFFFNSFKFFFKKKKISILKKNIVQWWFFYKQGRLWRKQLKKINKRFNKKKRIIDVLYFKKKHL